MSRRRLPCEQVVEPRPVHLPHRHIVRRIEVHHRVEVLVADRPRLRRVATIVHELLVRRDRSRPILQHPLEAVLKRIVFILPAPR